MKKILQAICRIFFLIALVAALFQYVPSEHESIAATPPLLTQAQEQPPAAPGEAPAEVKPPETRQGETTQPARGAGKAPASSSNTVSFFFDDADIYDVIQTVFGDILKVNYIIDPRVKGGKVNFRTVYPIPREEVLPVIEIILRMNGIGFVEERGIYNIVPLSEASKELMYAQMGKEPEKVLVELFTFKNLAIKDAVAELETAIGLGLESGRVRIIPVYRLNAVMVIASTKEQIDYVRRWIEKFDTMFAYARPKVYVYPLQNSKATHVASLLQSILGGGGGAVSSSTPAVPKTTPAAPAPTPGAPVPAAPRAGAAATITGGGGFMVLPDTKIFADEITNSLIILATPADYEYLEETIKKIDVVQRQVVIEALIARVDLTDNLSFGVAWSLKTDANILKPFSNRTNLTGDVFNQPVGTDLNSTPGSGFSFIATDPTGIVRAKLTAALKDSRAKILAAPHVLVSDNREARIQVGQQIPLSTSTTTTPIAGSTTTTTTNTVSSTIQYKDIGIILKVKPQVNDSGLVSLELAQEVSSVGDNVSIADQAFASINKTEATTNLVAQDGETIVIGGLIREDITKTKEGIPFLSKIPIIGSLFSNTTDNSTRSELIILLTPRVIKSMKDAGDVTTDYVGKYKSGAKDKEIDKFIEERGKKEEGGKVPPRSSLEPLDDEARVFSDRYARAYESGDIDIFMSLYSPSVVEDKSLRYEDIRRAYQENFRRGRYRYELSNIRLRRDDGRVVLTGAYAVKRAEGGALRTGKFEWILVREEGALRIIRADYTGS